MPIVVRSQGRLVGTRQGADGAVYRTGPLPASPETALALAGERAIGGGSYATLYKTQPAVRTVVDFAARNVAQLGLQAFRRINETDRERDRTSALARLIAHPNPFTTQYRWIEHSLIDFGVFGNAYTVKLRDADDGPPVELWRIPAARTQVYGELFPTAYGFWSFQGTYFEVPARDVIHLREANVDGDSPCGVSKLETLRKKLLEETYRQNHLLNYWRQGARITGVIERPLDAPEWDADARRLFRQEFAEAYGGARGAGLIPVLDEGMTFKAGSQTAEEQQLNDAREATEEEVVRTYHMPLAMVGLLRRATFSNVKEQHKMLYQDALGPTTQMTEQEFEHGLVEEFYVRDTAYLEFNVAEKLRGSFEEQAASLNSAIGRPWMTVNEGRARMNLPRDPDPQSDRVAMPLNMTTGQGTTNPAGAAA